MKKYFLILCGLLAACSPGVSTYRAETPVLIPENYWNGPLESWGVVRNWRGKVTSRFTMHMDARWEGNKGYFTESFLFDDGTRRSREWVVTKVNEREYRGTAPDVTKDAVGRVAGNALHWVYDIRLPAKDGTERLVTFDDQLFLVDKQTLFSFVTIRKFGVNVGEMTMVFRKSPA